MEIIGAQLFQLFFILIVYITCQLSMTLRVLLRWMTMQQVKKYTRIIIVYLSCAYLLASARFITIALFADNKQKTDTITVLIIMTFAFFNYMLSLLTLIRPLNAVYDSFSSKTIKQQKISILGQFLLFLITYLCYFII